MGYGLEIAVVGLVVVFAFLGTLVLSIQALGWFFRRFAHRFPDTREVAAIVAALTLRARERR
jgi:Na+-transporting methylmalonyl-CoA/oxaloacetate decarboxylase gamma subunit